MAASNEPSDATPWVPPGGDPTALAEAVAACRACGLWKHASHAVMGRGPTPARVVVVGEQPLRTENRRGTPFVGRAGMLLRRALADAQLDPESVWFTNVVKHSRFVDDDPEQRHEKPTADQVRSCRPWLARELALARPKVVVVLGRVATQAVLGKGFPARRHRGTEVELPASWDVHPAPPVVVTVRPSSVHRSRQRRHDYDLLVRDLRLARDLSLF